CQVNAADLAVLYDPAGALTSAGNRGGREQCNADRAENRSIAKGCMVRTDPSAVADIEEKPTFYR
ncbi:hypothetical protein, partial [Xanthomonas vesicatoria]